MALGDSTTVGVGDPYRGGWRGWAALLADALGSSQQVTFTNLAVSGATTPSLLADQLPLTGGDRIDLASLIVGVNDTMRSTFDPLQIRDCLHECAAELTRRGALLLTVRFHDHGRVFGLPVWLRRPLWRRIELVNAAYDEIETTYGGIRIDLAARPEVYRREFWSIDRLHPGERGHRTLARAFADRLAAHGVPIAVPPAPDCDAGVTPTAWGDALWMLREGAPWVGRRARDLGPWAARMAVAEARSTFHRRQPAAA